MAGEKKKSVGRDDKHIGPNATSFFMDLSMVPLGAGIQINALENKWMDLSIDYVPVVSKSEKKMQLGSLDPELYKQTEQGKVSALPPPSL